MALSTEIGYGGTGFHGDDSGKIGPALTAIATLANELKTDSNALATKLDADAGVTDTDYAAVATIAAANASGTATPSAGGGSGLMSDAGIALITRINRSRTLVNELRADRNILVAKLNADAGVTDTNYATITAAPVPALGAGYNAFAGDGGLGRALHQMVTVLNELRTKHGALLTKLDADAGVTDTNYAATLGITAPAV